MKKQTAVEWLKFQSLEGNIDRKEKAIYLKLPIDVFEKAEAMERQQIQLAKKESYNDGWLEATQYIFKKYKEQEDGR